MIADDDDILHMRDDEPSVAGAPAANTSPWCVLLVDD